MEFIEEGDPRWEKMWQRLFAGLEARGFSRDVHNHEAWQYMGTEGDEHAFRHRCERTTGQRIYAGVPVFGSTLYTASGGAVRFNVIGKQPEPRQVAPMAALPTPRRTDFTEPRRMVEGRDWICTGNFDGFNCGSDADPGL